MHPLHFKSSCHVGFWMLQESCSLYEQLVAGSVLAMARWDVDALISVHFQVVRWLTGEILI